MAFESSVVDPPGHREVWTPFSLIREVLERFFNEESHDEVSETIVSDGFIHLSCYQGWGYALYPLS